MIASVRKRVVCRERRLWTHDGNYVMKKGTLNKKTFLYTIDR